MSSKTLEDLLREQLAETQKSLLTAIEENQKLRRENEALREQNRSLNRTLSDCDAFLGD